VKNFIIFLVLQAGWSLVHAQNPVLTLGDCIDHAQQFSYMLTADDARVDAAQQNARLAATYAIPKVSGELGREDRLLKPFFFNQNWALIHADWSLGDYLLKTDQAAKEQITVAQLTKELTRLNAISRVTSLYMGILFP